MLFLPSPFLKMIFKSLKLICANGSGFVQHNQSGRFFEPITLHSFTLKHHKNSLSLEEYFMNFSLFKGVNIFLNK